MIPRTILVTEQLDNLEKLIYIQLYIRGNKEIDLNESKQLMKSTQLSRVTLRKYLKKLESKGLISIVTNYNDEGTTIGNTYTVHDFNILEDTRMKGENK